MTSLGVLVAPPGEVPLAVRDHLADWAAAGLVSPFLWVPAGRVTRHGTDALLVGPDGMSAVQMQAHVGRAAEIDQLVLCVLVPAGPRAQVVETGVSEEVWQQLRSARNAATVVPIRCVVARSENAAPVEVGSPGWHNLVVSPEQSHDPTVGVSPLPPSDDPGEIGPHAAVAVAGLAGLWAGSGGSPLARMTPVNGRYARLARSHLMWADGGSLSQEIEQKALDTSAVPRPTAALAATAYVDDGAAAAAIAAEQLLRAHATELRSGREPSPTPAITELGVGAALKMLWGFVAKALVNAPGTWARTLLAKARSSIADTVHQHVFGDGSTYQVVANLRTASPLEISRTAAQLGSSMDRVAGHVIEPTATFPGLWSDFVAGGLTLMDGGVRTEAVPPLRVGTDVAVVRSPHVVAPAPETRLRVDARVPGAGPTGEISPADELAMRSVVTLAEQARAADPRDERFSSTVAAVTAFRTEHGQSYAAQVGRHVGTLLLSLVEEVQVLAGRLSEAAQVDDGAELQAEQRRLGRRMQLLAALLVLGLVLVVALGVAQVLTTGWAVGAGVGLFLSWLVASLVTFVQGQRNLFAALNRREIAAGQAEANVKNLRSALRDLRRTSDAYSQLQSWSRVLGAFVHQPLGAPEPSPRGAVAGLTGLPVNVSLGELSQPAGQQDQAATRLRRRFFGVSWLSGPWRALLGDAPARLGPAGAELEGSPERLYAERADVEESLLDRWASSLETDGVGPAGGAAARQGIRDELGRATGGDDLLRGSEVRDVEGRTQPLASFLGGLADRDQRGQRFDGRILAVEARTDSRLSGVEHVEVTELPVLGRAVARIELSPDVPADLFVVDVGYAQRSDAARPAGPDQGSTQIDLVM